MNIKINGLKIAFDNYKTMITDLIRFVVNSFGFTLAISATRYIIYDITRPTIINYFCSKMSPLKTKLRIINKFEESMWRCLVYTGLCIMGGLIMFVPETKVWVYNTKYLLLPELNSLNLQ